MSLSAVDACGFDTIDLLGFQTGKVLQAYKGHTGPVAAIAFSDKAAGSGDQRVLISGSWDRVRWLLR